MRVLVTGGLGFIGTNAVRKFCDLGYDVLVLDNLSRKGSSSNLRFLEELCAFEFLEADLSVSSSFSQRFQSFKPERVLHLAGQVAVTTSVEKPMADFEGNTLATLNLLEECRKLATPPFVIYSSTNKVYGELEGIETNELPTRHAFKERLKGIPESQPLNFQSPYGCSKGAADQYVLEYSRTYGVPGLVMRQSCIYGPRQFGMEDQGWVAWFMIAALMNRQITVFGDGKQVRDLLHVEDLIDAYEAAFAQESRANGCALNIGGGPENTLSVMELLGHIGELVGVTAQTNSGPSRPSDQKIFVSDISRAKELLGWAPRIPVADGLRSLASWLAENLDEVESVSSELNR